MFPTLPTGIYNNQIKHLAVYEQTNYLNALFGMGLSSASRCSYSKGRQPTARGRIRPSKAFYPARDLLLSSSPRPFYILNDRYAPINRRNDPHLWKKAWISDEEFFFLVFAINSVEKRP